MYEINVDTERNRLYITLAGVIKKEAADQVRANIVDQVGVLSPGFDVITDVTKVECGYLSGLPSIKAVMEYLAEKEVGKVVRVVKGDSIFVRQVTKITQRYASYEAVYVATLEEAEMVLTRTEELIS